MFTDAEREFIGNAQRPGEAGLGHIATSTLKGMPHVVPLRAMMNEAGDKVLVLGNSMEQSYKYRQVQRNPQVAIVWDAVNPASGIKGVEVRGIAEIKQNPGDKDPHFEVTPTKVFSWGVNETAADSFEQKMGMDVSHIRNRPSA
jgi:pyridoxamine 5'-phosphate oxidase family protein